MKDKIKKIRVIVPQTPNEKWKVSFGKRARQRNSPATIFNVVERYLQPQIQRAKTIVGVKYDKDTFNESLASFNSHYLLFCLICFLEDYVNEAFLQMKSEKYQQLGQSI